MHYSYVIKVTLDLLNTKNQRYIAGFYIAAYEDYQGLAT